MTNLIKCVFVGNAEAGKTHGAINLACTGPSNFKRHTDGFEHYYINLYDENENENINNAKCRICIVDSPGIQSASDGDLSASRVAGFNLFEYKTQLNNEINGASIILLCVNIHEILKSIDYKLNDNSLDLMLIENIKKYHDILFTENLNKNKLILITHLDVLKAKKMFDTIDYEKLEYRIKNCLLQNMNNIWNNQSQLTGIPNFDEKSILFYNRDKKYDDNSLNGVSDINVIESIFATAGYKNNFNTYEKKIYKLKLDNKYRELNNSEMIRNEIDKSINNIIQKINQLEINTTTIDKIEKINSEINKSELDSILKISGDFGKNYLNKFDELKKLLKGKEKKFLDMNDIKNEMFEKAELLLSDLVNSKKKMEIEKYISIMNILNDYNKKCYPILSDSEINRFNNLKMAITFQKSENEKWCIII